MNQPFSTLFKIKDKKNIYCAFCLKGQKQVQKLLCINEKLPAFVCNECLELFNEDLAQVNTQEDINEIIKKYGKRAGGKLFLKKLKQSLQIKKQLEKVLADKDRLKKGQKLDLNDKELKKELQKVLEPLLSKDIDLRKAFDEFFIGLEKSPKKMETKQLFPAASHLLSILAHYVSSSSNKNCFSALSVLVDKLENLYGLEVAEGIPGKKLWRVEAAIDKKILTLKEAFLELREINQQKSPLEINYELKQKNRMLLKPPRPDEQK